MDLELGRRVSRLFRERYGQPGRCFFASGRVNLIGAHVDYHGGPVLPVAIDRGVFAVARARPDRELRFASCDFPGTFACSLDAPRGAALAKSAGWSAYPLGIVTTLADAGVRLPGFDFAFGGDVPAGAGMSSSAAILVATATAVAALAPLDLPPLEVGRLAHRAETGFVGVQCGIMDQFASALGRKGHALWLDCKDQSFDYLELPAERMEFVVLDSMTRRELKDGSYNQRVAESTGALAKLKPRLPGITCLRDVDAEQLDAHRDALTPLEWQRARHVVLEVARVRRARELLQTGRLLEFGQLMWQSHQSSRHLYEVSTPRLDLLQESAIGHPSCYGARLTGAGFGGCALAVVHAGESAPFCAEVSARFEQRFGQRPDLYPLRPGGAPIEVTADA